jgi:sporulation protein YlmC with PRC-barrel domain
MPHYGILREYRFEDINDVRGSEVYGVNDEKLGTIEDVVFDHSTGDIRYIVLKTGGLLSRKQILVPANRIDSYGNHEDKFYANLDKERLEMLPEFEDGALKSENDWSVYEREYETRLNDGAVMYNKDTGRIVTPPVEEVAGARREPLSAADKRSLDHDFTPQRMGKEDDYLGVGSPSENTTLSPQRASMGGREDVAYTAMGSKIERSEIGHPEIERPVIERPVSAPLENRNMPVDETLRERATRKANADISRTPPVRKMQEVTDTMGGEMEIPVEDEGDRINDNLRDPGIYRLDRQPDGTSRSNLGSRWSGFQDRLRSRRDTIVGDCPFCGSQDKVA